MDREIVVRGRNNEVVRRTETYDHLLHRQFLVGLVSRALCVSHLMTFVLGIVLGALTVLTAGRIGR